MIIVGCFFVSFGYSQTAPSYKTDFQFWNDTQIIVPLTKAKDWNFAFTIVGRFGNDLRTTVDARVGGIISKKLNDHVSVAGGYFYKYSNPTFVRMRNESRYVGFVIFTAPLGHKFTMVLRPQVQYEDRYSRPNAVVTESRFTLKRLVTLANKEFEPFVSFEPIYDFTQKMFIAFREQIGISHKFSKNVSADIGYLRQDVPGNRTRPGTLNGISTSLKVTVR